jgi:VWFA-related protein
MKKRKQYLFTIILLAGMIGPAFLSYGQDRSSPGAGSTQTTPSGQSSSTPVFRANSRLVVVDVVATDHRGEPVKGLKPGDFTLLEDGKPQAIAAFDSHFAESNKPVAARIQLPPHQFTNFPTVESNGPLNIVLFDLLNTEPMQQAFAKKQMVEFLKELPAGHRMALFVLGTRLQMIQGFLGNSDSLIAAGKSLRTTTSPVVTSEAQLQTDLATIDSARNMVGGMGERMKDALADQIVFQENQRVEMTLRALTVLAGAVSGYPGRKNVMWLSTNFPFRLGPQALDQTKRLHEQNQHDYRFPFRAVAGLLSAEQVAIYPIDIGGLSLEGTGGKDIGTPEFVGAGPPSTSIDTRYVQQRWDTHGAMTDIAEETGGKASYGTNDFKDVMHRSLRQGENYYTLAYVPKNIDGNEGYRKIEIKTPANGVKLEYRRGYFALAGTEQQSDPTVQLLASAMQPSVPEYTMLLLKVQVLPPDRDNRAVRIDYAVAPADISFSDAPDQLKHAHLDFMAVAWDQGNKEAGRVLTPVDFHIRNETYQETMRTGVPGHQELELKPGTYVLRVGVMDKDSHKIGTVDVPLTVDSAGNTRP